MLSVLRYQMVYLKKKNYRELIFNVSESQIDFKGVNFLNSGFMLKEYSPIYSCTSIYIHNAFSKACLQIKRINCFNDAFPLVFH